MIGIAELQRPLRHAVEARDDRVGLEVERRESMLDRRRQRVDIGRIVMIGRQRADRRLPAHRGQRRERLVVGGRGRRRAILRIERRDQDALAPCRLHRREPVGDRRDCRSASPNRPARGPKPIAERGACAPRDRGERRAVLGPDLPIGCADRRGPRSKNDAAQDRLPGDRRNLDDARVGEEFAEIALHRAGVRRVGRAEVDQQHADLRAGIGG